MPDDTRSPPPAPDRDAPTPRAGGPISRRRFLRRTLAGAALLAFGGTALRHLGGYHLDEKDARALRAFSPKEAIVFMALARRLLAADEAGAPSPDEIGVLPAVDAYVAGMPEALRADLKALLHLVEHSPVLFTLRPSRFTHLDDAGKDAVLADWATSRLAVRRQGFTALKSLAAIGYYGDPRTFGIPGWPGPMLPAR